MKRLSIIAGLLMVFLVETISVTAQRTDIYGSTTGINAKKYIRVHYANDFFTNIDYYFTQGITFEYAHPSLNRFPAYQLLFDLKQAETQQGITLDIYGFTPTKISSDTILYSDRPFAAALSARFFKKSLDQNRRLRLYSALHTGVIGPAALGEEIQTNIHRWTGNKIPKGWQYQVSNDLLLDYELYAEKNWIANKAFMLSGSGMVRLGTVNNKLGAGLNLVTGFFDDPFKITKKKKSNYYLFAQSEFSLVGYDAMLQGGLLNRKSPYTIAASDITRVTAKVNAGITIRLGKFQFSYSQSFLTKEFRNGSNHRWGGVNAAFILTE